MRLSYNLVQDEPKRPRVGDRLPSMDSLPILNQVQAVKVFHASFLKDCGDNDICESQLSVEANLNLPHSSKTFLINFLVLGFVLTFCMCTNSKSVHFELWSIIFHVD